MNKPAVTPCISSADSSFDDTLQDLGHPLLRRGKVETLQVNVGKLCNMACLHCHVEAGPKRTEIMERRVVERIVELVAKNPDVGVVDLTGGAPELNPDFRWLVEQLYALDRHVIDRCNLSILFEPGQQDLAQFLADHQVEVVASLPCYSAANVEKQRGKGAFDKSIRGLQQLNALGYGRPDSALRLHLVYTPVGPSLPPPQKKLEADYKEELARHFGIEFHSLLTITNMPIKRFAHMLIRDGHYDSYMELLVNSFNPATLPGLMCRSLLSVGWDGALYDCDFNQMLELDLGAQRPTVWDVDDLNELKGAAITTGSHCYGCTAGSGSSCSGALQ